MGTFEEKYNDTLRSMEIALVKTYREDEEMTDWETLTAVNGLIRVYTAEQKRRNPPVLSLKPLAKQSYDELKLTSDGWLGRAPVVDEAGQLADISDHSLSIAEVVNCLKRIRKSIEMWQREGGRRGYFNFIDQFLPQ